jgi:pyrimidine-nucleoside phosphorylase
MNAKAMIAKKRDGHALTREEMEQFVMGYVRGKVTDYQAAAWLMACFLQGLNEAETLALTEVMANSGERLDLSDVPPPTLDKHSTGGVGDKTSLILVPLLAAGGIHIAKMSGRGLGFTGGTVDKLESIPGYQTDLDTQAILRQVKQVGGCLVGQSEGLVPADKKLYALRDSTATVESIALIASSIMSKKLAGGAQNILLDVKMGSGSFMGDLEHAHELASTLVKIGQGAGRKTHALLTDMSQPLGRAVGNALEVREAIEVLTPGTRGDTRLRTLCLQLAAHAFVMCGISESLEAGGEHAEDLLSSGAALAKFRQIVLAQGGSPQVVDDPSLLPQAPHQVPVAARETGTIQSLDARKVAEAAAVLGAGRQKKEDPVDHAVGVEMLKQIGDRVQTGEPVFIIHAREESQVEAAAASLLKAIVTTAQPVTPPAMVIEVIRV